MNKTPNKNISRNSERTPLKRNLYSSLDVHQQFDNKFRITIQQPINIIEQLFNNKLPQKCLIHNNTFTLYCQNDRKPLCANCNYQTTKHKLHKLHPIKNCSKLLREDTKKYEQQIRYMLNQVDGVIKYVNQGLKSLEKQFPQTVINLQKYYGHLHQFLLLKQKQNVNQLQLLKQNLKQQYSKFSIQLENMQKFIKQKYEQFNRSYSQQQLLPKANIYSILSTFPKLVSQHLNTDIHKNQTYSLNYQIFDQIKQNIQEINNKLFKKKNKQRNNQKSISPEKKSTINSKSSKKFNTNSTPKTNKSRSKSPIPTHSSKMDTGNKSKTKRSVSKGKDRL